MTVAKLLCAVAAAFIACVPIPPAAPTAPAQAPRKLIPVEQYTLANGMKVIFHVDRSDPVVAVAINAHVGSSRETAGRTGFAHMFEHLYFLESEKLGKGGIDAMRARSGGEGATSAT